MSDLSGDGALGFTKSAFVGREREVAELCRGLDETRGGRGRLFLVTGEPGIGKTRLADEVAQRAASSAMIVLRAGCWEGAGAPAYWPFVQVVRSVLGGAHRDALLKLLAARNVPQVARDLGQLVPELQAETATPAELSTEPSQALDQARFRLFDSLATAIRTLAALSPLMLIIEDLHDADQPSLLLLRFVVGQLKDAPVLVLGTYRDIEVQRSPPLSQLIGDLTRQGIQIPLRALSRDETAQLIRARAGASPSPRLVSDVHQATGGNPLFIDGLIRVLAAAKGLVNTGPLNLAAFRVPDGVREAVRRWLALLSDRSVLITAAVIGQQFELRCLERISGLANHRLLDFMREASAVGIVTPVSHGAYRFSHALIHNALFDELNSAARSALHLRVGAALEVIHQSDLEAHVAELAHHFHEGGDIGKAIDYSIRAGEAARAVFAYEEAAAHWQTALRLMPDRHEDQERRAVLLESLGEWLGLVGSDNASQVESFETALKLHQSLGNTEAAARLRGRLVTALAIRMRPLDLSRASEYARQAREFLDRQEVSTAAIMLNIGLATTALESMDGTEAGPAASRLALEMSEQLGNKRMWARASIVHMSHLFHRGRLSEGFDLVRQVLERNDRPGGTIGGCGAAMSAAVTRAWLKDSSQTEILEREVNRERLAQAALLHRLLAERIGILHVVAGNLTRANALLSESRSSAAPSEAQSFLEGQIAFYRGEWEKAELVIGQALEQAHDAGTLLRACSFTHLLAKVHRVRGRSEEAEMMLRQSLAMCSKGQNVLFEMYARQELAQIYSETGRVEEAHSHLARCREVIATGEDWRGLEGQTSRAEAMVAAAQGRYEEAEPLFLKAADIHRRYGAPFEEAETLHHWGRALLGLGDRLQAMKKLDAATEIYRRHSAGKRWIERVRADRLSAQSAAADFDRAPHARHIGESEIGSGVGSDSEPGAAKFAGIFRVQGEYWTVSWAGNESRLKHRKGFHYIAWLLRHPSQEFAATDLVAAVGSGKNGALLTAARVSEMNQAQAIIARGLGDAGAVLDAAAKAQYKRRLDDLREELEQAQQLNDLGRADKLLEEIDFIRAEVAAAVGLRGRDRKHASHAERARLAVTKAIKGALNSIRQNDPELGRHLSSSIQTGYFCAYLPRQPGTWQL